LLLTLILFETGYYSLSNPGNYGVCTIIFKLRILTTLHTVNDIAMLIFTLK